MTDRILYATATSCTNIQSIEITGSYSQISSSATVECTGTTLDMGSAISIDMGYSDNHHVLLSGYVKQIERVRPEGIYRLTCYDELVKATDYFMASDNPEDPFKRNNILTLALIKDLLALASITNVNNSEPTPTFTWGTNAAGVTFNLQTVADAVNFLCQVTGNTIYADTSGQIHFSGRKPYISGGDTPTVTISDATGDIISCQYTRSNANLRNRVVVYGKTPITANGRADSPYVVVDQTLVLANELIDTQTIADGAVTANLDILNRLTENYELEILGNPDIQPRTILSLTESFSGTSARTVFCYRAEHRLSNSGYITSLTCTV